MARFFKKSYLTNEKELEHSEKTHQGSSGALCPSPPLPGIPWRDRAAVCSRALMWEQNETRRIKYLLKYGGPPADGGHPGGRRTGGHPSGRRTGGHGGGRYIILRIGIHACAMGEGGTRMEPQRGGRERCINNLGMCGSGGGGCIMPVRGVYRVQFEVAETTEQVFVGLRFKFF